MCAQSLSDVQFFATPWTIAHQAPLSIKFSRQGYWSQLPFPSPGGLADPAIKPESPALAGGFFALPHRGSPFYAFRSVQFSCSVLSDSLQPHGLQASLSITNSRSLLKSMSIELVMPFSHLILCHLLLLPSVFPSIRVFSNESVLRIRWLKYCSFSFSISLPMNIQE